MRRRLRSGEFYNLKAWVTGGPYAAVYLTGIKGATRNRKKVYIHRLVADHFLGASKKPNKVVHHEVGPHSNTKDSLKWVTPSENSKARKYFNDDGTRKSKKPKKIKKVTERLPVPRDPGENAKNPAKSKDSKQPKKVPTKRLPDDPDQEYPVYDDMGKMTWLYRNWAPFKKAWKEFRKAMKEVNQDNFPQAFKKATGKKLKLGDSPAAWNMHLLSAMYEIRRRFET